MPTFSKGVNGNEKRGLRLREEIEKKLGKDVSEREMSRKLGVNYSSLRTWLKGKSIPSDDLKALFDAGCDILFILTGEKHHPSLLISQEQLEVSETCRETAKHLDSLSQQLRERAIDALKAPRYAALALEEIRILVEMLEKLPLRKVPH